MSDPLSGPLRIISRPSPHHNARPAGTKIDLVVLHADAGRTEEGTLGWLASKESGVSYHYLIGRLGTIYQCVPDKRRAWHAGASVFEGRPNCNNYSLGVSFANRQDGEPFNARQLEAGVRLVADLCARHGIPVERITTHAAVSPGRKVDPGPLFPLEDFLARVAAALA